MITRMAKHWCTCIALFLLAAPTAQGNSISFFELGVLPPSRGAVAFEMSADGSTVIGVGAGQNEFVWTQETGMQALNDFGTGFRATAVSGNGEVIAGNYVDNNTFPHASLLPARVSLDPLFFDPLPLPALPASTAKVTAGSVRFDSSWDGSAVVGWVDHETLEDGETMRFTGAYRWDTGAPQFLFDAPNPRILQGIYISNDGSVVAGVSDNKLMHWTASAGTQSYDIFPPRVPGFTPKSQVLDLSGDGSTVVGVAVVSAPSQEHEAFRWTEANGYQVISAGGRFPKAFAVSADGSIIAGSSTNGAFLWDAQNGVRLLSDLLGQGGVDLTGWNLNGDVFLSDDGRTIAGNGINPDGQQAVWMARFPSASIVWTGFVPGGFWDDPANWDPQTVPGTNDNALFRGTNYLYSVPLSADRSVLCVEIAGIGTVEMFSNDNTLTATDLRMGTNLLDDVTLQLRNLELEVDRASLGAAEGAVAKLEVLDGGTLFGETVRVGAEERAELIVESGGTANISNLFIARNDGNDSQVTVRGGGVMSINTALRVGDNRPGKLFVQGGGRLSSVLGPSVFVNQGSRVEVDGAGTMWTTADSELEVSGGSFAIKNQAAAEFLNANVVAGNAETAEISVATQGELIFSDSLTILATGTGLASVAISENATLKVDDISVASSAPGAEVRASFLVLDGSAEISGDVTIDVLEGAGGTSGFDVSFGGSVVQTGSLTRVNDNGQLSVLDGGTWTNTFGDLTVDGGVVEVRDGSAATFDKIRLFGGDPQLGIDAGRVHIEDATVTANDRIIVGDGTPGRFALINGVLNASTEIQNTEHGRIEGNGRLNTPRVVGSGVVSPGLSPGRLTINGDLQLEAGGTLEMEFAGLTPDAEHDVLVVTGDTTIEGEVTLKFIDGFAPSQGDEFEFLISGGAADLSTATFDVQNLLPGFEFDIMPSAGGIMMMALNDGMYAHVTGDTNFDGLVNIDDLNAVRNNFGETGNADGTLPGDAAPFDGFVNIDDLNGVRNNFGAGASPVPEPSALLLALAAVVVCATARCHYRDRFRRRRAMVSSLSLRL